MQVVVVVGKNLRVAGEVVVDMDTADGKEEEVEVAADLLEEEDHNAVAVKLMSHIHYDDNWNLGPFGYNFGEMK